MNRLNKIFLAIALTLFGGSAVADAQIVRRANDTQIQYVLNSLETKTDRFQESLDRRMDNNRFDGTVTEDMVSQYLAAFENATDDLRNNFAERDATNSNVTAVMNYAWYLDDFMRKNRLAAGIESQWTSIRTDLDKLARYYRVSWNWNRTAPFPAGHFSTLPRRNVRVNRATDAQIRVLLNGLEAKTDQYRTTMDRRMDNTRFDDTRTEDMVSQYLAAFENATDDLRNNFVDRDSTNADVTTVLNHGWYLDDFMRKNRMGPAAERQWTAIRTDLNTLAGYYNVAWNWNRVAPYPADWFSRNMSRGTLNGTYRLNTSMSDDIARVIDRAVANDRIADRTRLKNNLERRLTAPSELAISRQGNNVTLGTNLMGQASIIADGIARSETNNLGATTRTTALLNGNTLTIKTDGDRARDYSVTFTPIGNDRLRMTRSIYLENRNEMISATSVYDQTSPVAVWPRVDRRFPGNNTNTGMNFYIPNGTQLTARLRSEISSDVSQAGDRFTMEVTGPSQYRGAIITGHLSEIDNSGIFTGRANLSMDFDTIEFRNRTYQFAGIIDSAREADGDVIRVDNEGTVRDGSQTTRTVTRAGVGAVLGAVIGAIAGGGEGAAIGAGIGAGAGAGSVLVQGRNEIELEPGSQFTITSSAPATMGVR